MATNMYEFEGELYWTKVSEPDEYNGNKFYVTNIHADKETYNNFKASGISTRVNEKDGKYVLKVKRPVEPKVFPDGTSVGGGKPALYDKDGNPWEGPEIIGNGTKAKVKVSVYDIKNRSNKGHRLEAIYIQEFVPYESVKEEDKVVVNETAVPF